MEMNYSYEINPRPVELGGGWQLRLLENGVEVGGGVFPPTDEFENPEDALQAAYEDAEWEAYLWLESCPIRPEERHRRLAAVDFAFANLALSGLAPSALWRERARCYTEGKIDLDEFLKDLPSQAKGDLDGH